MNLRGVSGVLLAAAASVCLRTRVAGASWITHLRDAITAPVRVPLGAVVAVVQHPTLNNAVKAVESPVTAVKTTADNVLGAANDAVEGHPTVQKVLEHAPVVNIPVAGGDGSPSGPGPNGSNPSAGTTNSAPPPGQPQAGEGATTTTVGGQEGPQSQPPVYVTPNPYTPPRSVPSPNVPSAPVTAPPSAESVAVINVIEGNDDGGYDQEIGDEGRTPAATAPLSDAAKALKLAADADFDRYAKDCSGSVVKTLGLLGNGELKGMRANGQVAYMMEHWQVVSGERAAELAAQGIIVVAGLQDQRPPEPDGSIHSGHVAVVVPGQGMTRPNPTNPTIQVFFPRVEGGSNGKTGEAISNGTKTAANVWNRTERFLVKYYTPKAN